MKLMLHLLRYDWLRLRPALVAWLVFVVVKAALVLLVMPGPTLTSVRTIAAVPLIKSTGLLELIAAGVIALSVGWENPPTGVRTWWLTRPISGRQLLAGKALAVGLGLVVAPAGLLAPVLFAAGLDTKAVILCLIDGALLHALMAVAGLTLALFRSNSHVGLGVLYVGTIAGAMLLGMAQEQTVPWPMSAGAAGLIFGGALALAYVRRRGALACAVVAAGFVVVAALGPPAAVQLETQPPPPARMPLEAGAEAGPWRVVSIRRELGFDHLWLRYTGARPWLFDAGWRQVARTRVRLEFPGREPADQPAAVHMVGVGVASAGFGHWVASVPADASLTDGELVIEPASP